MQSKLNEPISRRHFLAAAGLSMTCMLTTGCSITVSSKSSNESEKSSITLIGAYHPLTGQYDPQDSLTDPEQIAYQEQVQREREAQGNVKTVFILAEVTPDAKKNIKLRNAGNTTSAELTVDKSNTYTDDYGEKWNNRKWHTLLTQLGFHTGGGSDTTLYAGSNETYKQVFMFVIGNNDLENGKTASVKWGDFTLNFDMSQIQDVATPKAMVAQLQG